MALDKPLQEDRSPASLGDLAKQFFILGVSAFGGPAVHFGMYQAKFVDTQDSEGNVSQRKWLPLERYAELMAMASCLPGPSSTQVAFAIGITQQGVIGGLTSGFAFLLPGAVAMTGLGFVSSILQDQVEDVHSVTSGVAQTCSCVGVALVFKAVTDLVSKFGKEPALKSGEKAPWPKRAFVCCGVAATCLLASPAPAYLNPLLIFLGGLVTVWFPVDGQNVASTKSKVGLSFGAGVAIFVLYFIATPATLWLDAHKDIWLGAFLTAGMFVWGGGPVVLPMLMTALVPKEGHQFVNPTTFLTGIAFAEMMPGPVFNMSCFLGVQIALKQGFPWLAGTVLAWAGLVGPGVLLTFGAMPLWESLRSMSWYKKALPGLNAAAVGLLLSTLFFVYQALMTRAEAMNFVSESRALSVVAYAIVGMQAKSRDDLVPLVVLGAAAIGAAWAKYMQRQDAMLVSGGSSSFI